MVYLPGALSQRRSQQASDLYQDQAAAGVVAPPLPQQPVATPSNAGGVPTPPGGPAAPTGQQRPSRMTEYLQAQQSQRDQLAARGQDLQLAQVLSRALDPTMPKGFRQLGLKQVSQMLGIDPKGERSKEIINTLSGLDPQSLEGIRRGILTSTNDAQPGELTQTTRGILTGQVPPEKLLDMAKGALQPPAGTSPQEGAQGQEDGMMRLGGPATRPAGAESAVTPAQTAVPTMPGDTGERAPSTRRLFENVAPGPNPVEATSAPGNREVIPEMTRALGLDPTQRYRVQDLQAAGYNIPSNEAGMRTSAGDINASRNALVNSYTMMSELAGLVRGNPEALGYPIARIHVPSTLTQMGEYLKGWGNMLGITIPPGDSRRVLDNNKDQIDAITRNVATWIGDTGARIKDAAEVNSRIKSILVPLAFAMAAAEGQTGRHLSDRDVALQLERLGQSNDPNKFIAALTQTAHLLQNQYDTRMQAQVGRPLDLGPSITPQAAALWRAGGIIAPPGEELPAVGRSQRSAPSSVPPAAPAAPPAAPVAGPGMGIDIGGERTEMPAGPLPQAAAPPAAPAAPAEAAPPAPLQLRAAGTVPRSSPTLEESETAGRQRLQEERDYLHETRYQQRRGLELRENAEARADRAEVEARRSRIQQAFAQIGAALRSASSGGGGGVSGGGGEGQDPNAFRITPPPQRRPPSPVPAAPFQPQPPQRRR